MPRRFGFAAMRVGAWLFRDNIVSMAADRVAPTVPDRPAAVGHECAVVSNSPSSRPRIGRRRGGLPRGKEGNGGGSLEWLEIEPLVRTNQKGVVVNGGQRYGTSRGRTAESVKRALRDAGLSQSEAARKLGITQVSMNKICTGKSLPAFGVAIELSRLLGLPVHEVVDFDEVATRWREERDARSDSALKLEPKPKSKRAARRA